MRITCAGCTKAYNLTPEEIQKLPGSILPCGGCGKYIKITKCPRCNAIYSITFSVPARSRYTLTCERCARPFIIDFPSIHDASKVDEPARKKASRPFITPFFLNRKKVDPQIEKSQALTRPRHSTFMRDHGDFTLGGFLEASGRSLMPAKLITAASAVAAGSLVIFVYNRLISLFNLSESLGGQSGHDSIASFIHLMPFALLFLIYLTAASAIAMIELDRSLLPGSRIPRRILSHLGRSIVPVILASTAILLALSLILALFGAIPLVGPLLFAILFLPLYAASLVMAVILAVAFWFFPPIVASMGPGAKKTMNGFLHFVKRHGLGLAYVVPLLTIITAAASSVVFILHQVSVSLALGFSSYALGATGESYFPAAPSPLLSLSDLAMIGSDTGPYRTVINTLLSSNPAAGIMIAVALSFVAILLFTLLISFTATISTHAYTLMEGTDDSNDADRVRLLLLALLLLVGILLLRRVVF